MTQLTPATPTILAGSGAASVFVAEDDAAVRNLLTRALVQNHITKPFDVDAVVEAVSRLIVREGGG